MKDEKKTKKELIEEVVKLRKQVKRLDKPESSCRDAGDKLRESEERYRTIFDQASDSIVLIDPTTAELVEFNDKAHEILDYTREEFSAINLSDIEIIESENEIKEHLDRIIKTGGDVFETKQKTKKGEIKDIRVSARVITIQGKKYVQNIWTDITERKPAEEAIRSQRDLGIALSAVSDLDDALNICLDATLKVAGMDNAGIYIINEDTGIMEIAQHMGPDIDDSVDEVSAYGYDSPNFRLVMSGKPSYSTPDKLADILQIPKKIKLQKSVAVIPIHHEGQVIGALIASSREYDYIPAQSSVALESIIAHMGGVVARVRAQHALEKASGEWRKTFDTISDVIMITDKDYKIRRVNKAAANLLRLPFHEILDQPCYKLMHDLDYPPDYCPHSLTVKDRKEHSAEIFEKKFNRDFALTSTPMLDESGNFSGSVLVMRDITDAKKLKEHLQKSQKLESIGVLAGGLAHDFNNILTAILGNIQLAKIMAGTKEDLVDILADAENASLRAKSLTHKLLTFAKGGVPIKKIMPIGDLIREAADFALRGSSAVCDFVIPDDAWPVNIDEAQISQAINNIFMNSVQAMPEGGRIEVHVENVTAENANIPARGDGKYLKICIRDSGIGIPLEHLPRIFDPYFTTKQKGSGLGLATVYSIIEKHGGFINVESELNKGTTLEIYIPAAHMDAAVKPITMDSAQGLNFRVLFMDDEDIIRSFISKALKGMGYEVALASSGAEAIELYKEAMENGKPFDLVIMDLTVRGGMGGKDAIQEIKKLDPNVKAIVSSGYSNDPIMAEYKKHGFRGVIVKPYKIEDLAEALQSLLVED